MVFKEGRDLTGILNTILGLIFIITCIAAGVGIIDVVLGLLPPLIVLFIFWFLYKLYCVFIISQKIKLKLLSKQFKILLNKLF